MWLNAADLPRRLPDTAPVAALIIGDEPLLIEESADALRRLARASGFNEKVPLEPGPGFSWDQLIAEGGSMSLFGDRRMLELRLPEAKPGADGAREIQGFLQAQPPDVMLLVLAPCSATPPKDAAWMQRLAEAGIGVRCRKLRARDLPRWLEQRARQLQVELAPEALRWLAEQVEGNLLAAKQELEKLPLLRPGARWSLEDLQAVVADHARFLGYELPDVLLAGDLATGVRRLQRLRQEGVPPLVVLSTLARDVRALHMAVPVARQVGPVQACARLRGHIWPSRARVFTAALQRLTPRQIRALHLSVIELDRLAKSAPEARFWEDLLNLCVALAGPKPRQVA